MLAWGIFFKAWQGGGTHWCFLKWGNYLVNKKDDCQASVTGYLQWTFANVLGSVLSTSRGVPLILTTTLTGKHIIVPILRTQRPGSLKGAAHGAITSKWWPSNESLRKGEGAGVLSRGRALETQPRQRWCLQGWATNHCEGRGRGTSPRWLRFWGWTAWEKVLPSLWFPALIMLAL